MSDKLTVNLDGKDKELFMSFGLLNELSRLVGDPANVAIASVDPEMREKMLKALLSERDGTGKITKEWNPLVSGFTMEQANQVLEWVAENLIGFFVTSLEGAERLREKLEKNPVAQKLLSSQTGSAS